MVITKGFEMRLLTYFTNREMFETNTVITTMITLLLSSPKLKPIFD